jgi:uncharacterized OB-fold protein
MRVPRYTREIPQRYRLEAGKCSDCGFLAFPPRLVCPECGKREFETISLTPAGTILTYTICHVAADYFATETPFAVGIIETDDGARLTTQIVDCDHEEIEIGKRVRLMLRCVQREGHSGALEYGYKAVLE